jgi:hypothetical protein
MELFEKAARWKLRFPTPIGHVTVEDLWDLPLLAKGRQKACLNDVAKALNKQVKASDEEDFVNPEVEPDKELKAAFEIVKHVISVKIRERDAAEKAQETKQKKARILELIAKKQDEALAEKSEEELRALVNGM